MGTTRTAWSPARRKSCWISSETKGSDCERLVLATVAAAGICSRDMVVAIKAAGGKKILYREYKGLGHNVWTPTFSDDKVFEWLFSQRRRLIR